MHRFISSAASSSSGGAGRPAAASSSAEQPAEQPATSLRSAEQPAIPSLGGYAVAELAPFESQERGFQHGHLSWFAAWSSAARPG